MNFPKIVGWVEFWYLFTGMEDAGDKPETFPLKLMEAV